MGIEPTDRALSHRPSVLKTVAPTRETRTSRFPYPGQASSLILRFNESKYPVQKTLVATPKRANQFRQAGTDGVRLEPQEFRGTFAKMIARPPTSKQKTFNQLTHRGG